MKEGLKNTDLTHFRPSDSACSSTVRASQFRFEVNSCFNGSFCSSGRANGIISSSIHRREQRSGHCRAKRSGMAKPMNFSKCSELNCLSLVRTYSTILSSHPGPGVVEMSLWKKSRRYVVSRIAMARVDKPSFEGDTEYPANIFWRPLVGLYRDSERTYS